MAKKKIPDVSPKLTETERDLLSHIRGGYQLETDSLGGNPILRRLKDNEEIRPLSANRNTIKAMEQRGLIRPGNGRDPLTIRRFNKFTRGIQHCRMVNTVLRRSPAYHRATIPRLTWPTSPPGRAWHSKGGGGRQEIGASSGYCIL